MIKNIFALLFSFKGRLSRKKFILLAIPLLCLIVICNFISQSFVESLEQATEISTLDIVFYCLFYPIWLSIIISIVSISVRRLHDFNHPSWLVIILLVPVIGFWFFVCLMYKKGMVGENKYGLDPLQQP